MKLFDFIKDIAKGSDVRTKDGQVGTVKEILPDDFAIIKTRMGTMRVWLGNTEPYDPPDVPDIPSSC